MLRSLLVTVAVLPCALALEVSFPGAVGAQTQEAPERGCKFRGRPLPACKGFLIFEMQGSKPIVQTTHTILGSYRIPHFGSRLEWNLGAMVNVAPTLALGGVFTAGVGGERSPLGFRIRGRRWLTDEMSVEVEGGLLRESGRRPSSGLTAGTRLNVRDQLSFFLRWEGLDVPGDPPAGGFQQALSVGAGLGSGPALIGTGVAAVGFVILALIVISDPNFT